MGMPPKSVRNRGPTFTPGHRCEQTGKCIIHGIKPGAPFRSVNTCYMSLHSFVVIVLIYVTHNRPFSLSHRTPQPNRAPHMPTCRSRGWATKCRFHVTLSTRVPHASKRSKTTLLPTYEWAVRTSGLRMVKAILSTMHHAPEAQQGPTPRPRCHHKRAHHALCSPLTKLPILLICAAR